MRPRGDHRRESAQPLREQATDGARRVAEVLAHGAAEVGLVGEAEVGGEGGEVAGAGLQPVECAFDPDPVAVPGERHPEVPAERPAEPERRHTEERGERQQPAGRGVVGPDGFPGAADQRVIGGAVGGGCARGRRRSRRKQPDSRWTRRSTTA